MSKRNRSHAYRICSQVQGMGPDADDLWSNAERLQDVEALGLRGLLLSSRESDRGFQYFFNHKDISEIVFMGYVNEEEIAFRDALIEGIAKADQMATAGRTNHSFII